MFLGTDHKNVTSLLADALGKLHGFRLVLTREVLVLSVGHKDEVEVLAVLDSLEMIVNYVLIEHFVDDSVLALQSWSIKLLLRNRRRESHLAFVLYSLKQLLSVLLRHQVVAEHVSSSE